MDHIPTIDSQFIDNNTDYKILAQRLRDAFAKNAILVPQRHHHDFPNPKEGVDSTMLLMPAWDPDHEAGVKIVAVSPNNSKYNLPSIEGVYILFDAQKGQIQAILDAKALTNKRTAAASALASSFLSRPDASSLLMVGTGSLSRNLIEAHASLRPIEQVFVYGRNLSKAEKVVEDLQGRSFNIQAVEKMQEVIKTVDVISCATLSSEPLIQGRYLTSGQHLDMVGAYKVDMREADDEVLQRSSIFVDNFSSAIKETGDLVIPLNAGVISREHILADLFGLCSGAHHGRRSVDEITFFKSVGHALEDLVGASYYFKQFSDEHI